MKNFNLKLLSISTLLNILLLPNSAFAKGFINCSGATCSACNFVDLANELLGWLISMAFLFFAVLAVIAGFNLVTSGGKPDALTDAKQKFVNAFIGLIIILAAFLLVDNVMRALLTNPNDVYVGYGPWSEVKCGSQAVSKIVMWAGDPASPNAGSNVISTTGCSASTAGNTDCSAASAACTASGNTPEIDQSDPANHQVNCWEIVRSAPAPLAGPAPATCSAGSCVPLGSVPCKSAASCSISGDLQPKLLAMHNAAGVSGARVTEAMPPTRVHKSPCHQNGTCVDYGVAGGMAPTDVVKIINAANANGLRPVYEVKTRSEKDALIAAGAPAANISVLGSWITAPHFSIYGN